jgi:Ca2+-transporting ATPase
MKMTKGLWCHKSVEQTISSLESNSHQGLDSVLVKQRQALYKNQLITTPRRSATLMLLSQFTDTMVLVLLGATVISGLVGAMVDAITIMAIVVINALLGFIQEYRAEKSLEEIKKLTASYAQVIRGGKRIKIPSQELVPGDIVLLEAGDKVPADGRIIESSNLPIRPCFTNSKGCIVLERCDVHKCRAKNTWVALTEECSMGKDTLLVT